MFAENGPGVHQATGWTLERWLRYGLQRRPLEFSNVIPRGPAASEVLGGDGLAPPS